MKIGNDLVEVRRFLELVSNKRFLDRVFSTEEQEHIFVQKDKQKIAERMAGKFATKEAVAKALGLGISGGINFLSITVLPDEFGAPTVTLFDEALAVFRENGFNEINVSISNTSEYAESVCLLAWIICLVLQKVVRKLENFLLFLLFGFNFWFGGINYYVWF